MEGIALQEEIRPAVVKNETNLRKHAQLRVSGSTFQWFNLSRSPSRTKTTLHDLWQTSRATKLGGCNKGLHIVFNYPKEINVLKISKS